MPWWATTEENWVTTSWKAVTSQEGAGRTAFTEGCVWMVSSASGVSSATGSGVSGRAVTRGRALLGVAGAMDWEALGVAGQEGEDLPVHGVGGDVIAGAVAGDGGVEQFGRVGHGGQSSAAAGIVRGA